MRVVQVSPGPALAPFVRFLGYYEMAGPSVRERVLPSGGSQLLVNLHEDEMRTYDAAGRPHRTPGAALQVAQQRPEVIDTAQQRAIVVACFRPGGSYPFFAPPAAATADTVVGLDALCGPDGAALRDRLLEVEEPREKLRRLAEILAASAVRPLDPDPAIGYAAAALGRGVPVAEVIDRLGTTPKALLRRFRDQVGLTPKRFARLRRFQRALASIPYDRPVDWAEIAAGCGYFDQSHLIRDFREFAGIRPTEYRARSPHEPNHALL